MSHLDEQIAEALAHGPDTLTCILAQALTTARARVAELEARRVVVQDLSEEDLDELAESVKAEWHDEESDEIAKAAYSLAVSRANTVATDRVLGDRMVQVSVDAVEAMSSTVDKIVLDSWARSEKEDASVTALCLAFQPIRLSLRASQGGAAT